jgi:hypothetical protein
MKLDIFLMIFIYLLVVPLGSDYNRIKATSFKRCMNFNRKNKNEGGGHAEEATTPRKLTNTRNNA